MLTKLEKGNFKKYLHEYKAYINKISKIRVIIEVDINITGHNIAFDMCVNIFLFRMRVQGEYEFKSYDEGYKK